MVEPAGLIAWIDGRQDQFVAMADAIWRRPELAFAESHACELQLATLRDAGFRTESHVAGLPTAFVAEWGSGGPVIGLLGEYDALPGLSQHVQPVQSPVVPGGPGHACGHHLLGVGSLAAACAARWWLASTGHSGTVRYYGCPAEESGSGKAWMARAGVFDDLDAALTWHPGSSNRVGLGSSLATAGLTFRFHGRASHAAAAPHLGRSALDAVELMNVGVNYLREHVVAPARITYVISSGGGQLNVVPAYAESRYSIRAPRREQVEEIVRRVRRVAEGATLMTETTVTVEERGGTWNLLPNRALAAVVDAALHAVGPLAFSAAERDFARQLVEAVHPPEYVAALGELLVADILPPLGEGAVFPTSTDVGDVSWITPTVELSTVCWPRGIAPHTWSATAAGGSTLGQKGMLHAARALAVAVVSLFDAPAVLAQARGELDVARNGQRYRSLIPDGARPPAPGRRAAGAQARPAE